MLGKSDTLCEQRDALKKADTHHNQGARRGSLVASLLARREMSGLLESFVTVPREPVLKAACGSRFTARRHRRWYVLRLNQPQFAISKRVQLLGGHKSTRL